MKILIEPVDTFDDPIEYYYIAAFAEAESAEVDPLAIWIDAPSDISNYELNQLYHQPTQTFLPWTGL